jgi:hypothetical protein
MTEATNAFVDETVQFAPKMRAVRFHGPHDVRVDEIDEPVCGKGQVKMRPAYTGLCGTGKLRVPLDTHPADADLLP